MPLNRTIQWAFIYHRKCLEFLKKRKKKKEKSLNKILEKDYEIALNQQYLYSGTQEKLSQNVVCIEKNFIITFKDL